MAGNNKSSSAKRPDMSSKSKAFEGLPVKFVTAMRTLFDILDEQKTGFIALADFEMYMRQEGEDGSRSVPLGVVDSLRFAKLFKGTL
jgi:Ca2+-binding EF-hand superfamily protein